MKREEKWKEEEKNESKKGKKSDRYGTNRSGEMFKEMG